MKKFTLSKIMIVLAIILSPHHAVAQATGPFTGNKAQLLQIAKDYTAEKYPDVKAALVLKPTYREREGCWEVTFGNNQSVPGGAPVLCISKTTLKVNNAYLVQ